jgi:EpsI family protein
MRMRNSVITVFSVAALGLALWGGFALQPTKPHTTQNTRIELRSLVPDQFGAWQLAAQQPAPQLGPIKQRVEETYDQTLERLFVREDGTEVMLVIAYGGDQSGSYTNNDAGSLQIHRQEYCYLTQGYEIRDSHDTQIQTSTSQIPVRRLITQLGPQQELITYWVTIGKEAQVPGFGRRLAQIRYGLRGEVPDGMLIRMSTVSANAEQAFAAQEDFAKTWLANVGPTQQRRLGHNPPDLL